MAIVTTLAIKLPQAELDHIRDLLGGIPDGMARAFSRAVNRIGGGEATKLRRTLAQKLGVKVAGLAKTVRFRRASAKDPNSAKIDVYNFKIALKHLKGKRAKKRAELYGHSRKPIRVTPDGQMFEWNTNFYARDKNTPKRAMSKGRYAGRTIKEGPRKGQPLLRQPIWKLHVNSPRSGMDPGLVTDTLKAVNARLLERLRSQTRHILDAKHGNPDS